MTNYEHYKDTIKRILESSDLAVCKNEPVKCNTISCKKCDCSGKNASCRIGVLDWCMQEYKEKPKLTEREKAFCVAAESGYIARDENGYLYYFKEKPIKIGKEWRKFDYNIRINGLGLNFSFIGWNDEEPWTIKNLLE